MAVVELTLVPIGTQKTSCSPFVAAAYDAVKDNDKVEIRLNPMGTVLEGDIDELFACVRKMQEAVASTPWSKSTTAETKRPAWIKKSTL